MYARLSSILKYNLLCWLFVLMSIRYDFYQGLASRPSFLEPKSSYIRFRVNSSDY